MTRLWLASFVVFAGVLVSGGTCAALSPHYPHSAQVSGLSGFVPLVPVDGLHAGPSELKPGSPQPRLRFTAFVPGQGRLRFDFARVRKTPPAFFDFGTHLSRDPKGVALLKGRYSSVTHRGSAGAAIYRSGVDLRLYVGFLAASPRNGRQRYFRLAVPLKSAWRVAAGMQRLPSLTSFHKSCGGALLPHFASLLSPAAEAPVPNSSAPLAAGTVRVLQLALDADAAWNQIYRGDSNAAISAFVNEALALYEDQLAVTFDIVRQHVHTWRSFGSSDAISKLYAYQSYTTGQGYFGDADAYHLFTGEDLNENVIGLSYVGVICRSLGDSFGLTQSTNAAFTPITFAHELAHNFGAYHDESQPPTIMYPAITNPPSHTFSGYSRDQIRRHVAQYGDVCLGSENGPNPQPSPSGNPTGNPTGGPTGYPTPRPTNGGGGGGGNSGGDPRPPVPTRLKVQLSAGGEFMLTVTLDEPRPDCKITLFGNTQKVVRPGMPRYGSFRGDINPRVLSGTFTKKTNGTVLYLMAKVKCQDGSVGQSGLRPLNTARLSKLRQSVDFAVWQRLFKRLLRTSVAAQ